MNKDIKELADRLHELYLQIMNANPWDEGYGEVVSIHEYLLKVLRDKSQKDFEEFQSYLKVTAKEIEEMWSSNTSALKSWSDKLKPVFDQVELIIGNTVPLLKLIL